MMKIHPMIIGACAGAATSFATGWGPHNWQWWIPFLSIGILYAFFTKRGEFHDENSSTNSDT